MRSTRRKTLNKERQIANAGITVPSRSNDGRLRSKGVKGKSNGEIATARRRNSSSAGRPKKGSVRLSAKDKSNSGQSNGRPRNNAGSLTSSGRMKANSVESASNVRQKKDSGARPKLNGVTPNKSAGRTTSRGKVNGSAASLMSNDVRSSSRDSQSNNKDRMTSSVV